MRTQIMEHTAVNGSVHTGCTQHQRVCMLICLCVLCEWGLKAECPYHHVITGGQPTQGISLKGCVSHEGGQLAGEGSCTPRTPATTTTHSVSALLLACFCGLNFYLHWTRLGTSGAFPGTPAAHSDCGEPDTALRPAVRNCDLQKGKKCARAMCTYSSL